MKWNDLVIWNRKLAIVKRRRLKDKTPQLLYSRLQIEKMLNVSRSSLLRMEARGVLTPVRITGRPAGKTFYRASEVEALVAGSVKTVDGGAV